MQNNDLSNSLYFSNRSQFKQNIYRGYFMLKNTNISILDTKNKLKYENNRTELNESFFISNSLQQISNKRPAVHDNLSYIEDSQEQKILKKPLQGHQFAANLKPALKHQQILPQLSTTQQVVSLKLLSRQQKVKPIIKQQKSQEHIIQLRYLNKQFEELQKGLILKCLYLSTNDRDLSIDKIAIMNFENFLIQSRKNFWDFRNEMKICPSFLRGSIFEQCESPYCPCTLRNDLKNTLKMQINYFNISLSKTYLIVFLFNSQAFAQVWQKYLFYNGFFIDAMYLSKNQTQPQQQLGGIKINQIIRDFSKFKITRILHFDSVDMTNTFPNISVEQFQNKFAILDTNIETILFLFQQLQNPKQFDSKLLCDICVSFQNDHRYIVSRKSVTILPIDISYAYNYYSLQEKMQYDKLQIVHKLTFVQEQLQQNIDSFDLTLVEEEEDQLIKWIDQTNDKMSQSIRREKFKEKTPLLQYTIGDLITRNHKFKKIYYNYPEKQLLKKQSMINKKIARLSSEIIVQKNKLKNLLSMNCFLCIE
ncbi:unnamed protein product [Paramecium sonneborni]|uniref:Uncharacterized protein n=1 Tax=Paramecium sonneborni TaxID=65129 RepID=A0A8S1R3G0_9CILI|nr:unnamed protein product [Paramecium sonneborni]